MAEQTSKAIDQTQTAQLQVEHLADKVKSFTSLTDELNQLPFQERLSVARAVQAQIDKGKEEGSLPTLIVQSGLDSQGHEHLSNLQYTTANKTADLYDLPGTIEQKKLKQEFMLDLDSANSKHLKSGGKEIWIPGAGS